MADRHAPADEEVAVAHRARRRAPTGPAEARGALPVAGAERFTRPGLSVLRVGLGVVAQPERDRVELERVRQLVQRGLQRERPGRLAGRALERRGRNVEPHEAVRRLDVRAGVKHPGLHRARLDELVEAGSLGRDLVPDRGEPPARVGAEGHLLDRAGAVSDEREHLRPGEGDLHPAPDDLGPHRGEGHVRPGGPFAAEASSDVMGENADVLGLEAEDRRDLLPDAEEALGRVVERQATLPLPDGDRRVRLHRVVVLERRRVRRFDPRARVLEACLDVAALRVGLAERARRLRLVRSGQVRPYRGPDRGRGHGPIVGHAHEARRILGALERVGDDERDGLIGVEHAVVLQELEDAVDRVRLLARARELGRVRVGQHREHPTAPGARARSRSTRDPAGRSPRGSPR